MKKYLFLIVMSVGFAACGNSGTKEVPATETEATPVETAVVPAGQTDPICKMEREKGWTDHAVSATGDTTWFCSTTCKDVFVARNK